MPSITPPSFNADTNTISIPEVDKIDFLIRGQVVTGDVVINSKTTVRVAAQRGYILAKGVEREYIFEVSKSTPSIEEKPKEAEPVVTSTAGEDPENPAQVTQDSSPVVTQFERPFRS